MTDTIQISPQITHFSWGELQIEGLGQFKDAKLYPGGACAWDWGETGTQHNPGIQIADVTEVIEQGATVVILSKGVQERLHVMDQTLDYLDELGLTVHVLQTEQAIDRYNELAAAGEPVGALIHSTC